jgi:hypothetical protein
MSTKNLPDNCSLFTWMFLDPGTIEINCAQKLVDDDECFRTVDDFAVFCPGGLRKSSVDVR